MSRYMILFMILSLSSTMSLAQKDKAWLRQWAGSGTTYQEDWARDIALDDSGNVYVTGICNAGSVGGGYVTLKYSRTGRLRWERFYYGSTYNEAHAIAIDSAYNVWVTGESGASATRDIYTVGYNPDGEVVWGSRSDFNGGTDVGYAIDASAANTIAYTGYTSKSGAAVIFHGATDWVRLVPQMWGQAIDICNSTVTVAGKDSGGFGVARYDLEGNALWRVRSGAAVGGYSVAVSGLVVDTSGNSYVTGTTGDLYTVAFDPSGNVRWSALYIGPRRDEGVAIALDSKGNVISAGSTDQSTGSYYAYRGVVMKHDADGNTLWSKVLDFGGVNEHLYTMAVGRGDTIYVAGDRYASQSGDADYLIAKLSPSGDVVWWTTYAGNGSSYSTASAIAVDTSGGLYVTGWSSQNNEWPDNADIVTIKFWNRKTFRPDRDGWQFANFRVNMWPQSWWSQFDYTKAPYPFFLSLWPINATSADFPDWPLFVNVFGIAQCYKNAAQGEYYFVPSALLRWRTLVEWMKSRDSTGQVTSYWNGSCAGFTLSALLYFNDVLSLQWTLGGYDTVYSVPLSDESRYLVNKHYATYLGNFQPSEDPSASQVFDSLKVMLVENYTNDRWIGMYDAVTWAGHAVVACSLASIGSGWWEIPIYDPNHPGEYMHLNYSEITEEWTAQEAGWNNLIFQLMPIGTYGQTPVLPGGSAAAVMGSASDAYVSVFNSPYAGIRIRDATGQTIGYADGAPIDSMPGAQPMIDFGGGGHPPGGYFLPVGEYTASVESSLDSTTYLALFLEGAAFSFHRQGAAVSDNERVHFSAQAKSLSVGNPDPGAKPLLLQCIESLSGEETVCRLHVQAMPGGDSLGLQLAGERNVTIVVGGSAVTADLQLELVKDYANPAFRYAGLMLEAGASYLVTPVWDSLAVSPVSILVDRNRDGTVDDTLRLENQAVGVPDGGSGRTPERFELYQNYPNPFNPITTIKYELSNASLVRLSVYDLLGREVSVLVNERRDAGVHEVKFDGSGLSSGVYLYRLQAGDFVQTRKLVLLQ